jgi:hypothetical protein
MLIDAKLKPGKRSQKQVLAGRNSLGRRWSALDCSAIEEEEENNNNKKKKKKKKKK